MTATRANVRFLGKQQQRETEWLVEVVAVDVRSLQFQCQYSRSDCFTRNSLICVTERKWTVIGQFHCCCRTLSWTGVSWRRAFRRKWTNCQSEYEWVKDKKVQRWCNIRMCLMCMETINTTDRWSMSSRLTPGTHRKRKHRDRSRAEVLGLEPRRLQIESTLLPLSMTPPPACSWWGCIFM